MKWHLWLPSIVGLLFLLAGVLSNAQEAKKEKDAKKVKAPNYYPLQVGNQWDFRVEVMGNSASAVSKIAKIEKIDDVLLARLEATVNGKIVATEHLRQTDQGIFRHRNNGQEISPPICLLKYPVKPGDKWDGDITVGTEKGKYFCEAAEEQVGVPAGKFKATRVKIRLETEQNGVKNTVNTTYWFVLDIGFVRQTVDAGNLNIVMELEKFEPANDKKK
jgi:hypothetical protein